jgi:heme-degrading monooxygenase HmoA
MYIAMNRFKVKLGSESEFERIWRERDSYLDQMPGFVEFHLLKGAKRDDHTLYSSHTTWRTHADFDNWTKSDQFRIAHSRAGTGTPIYLGHPEFEGFESVLDLAPAGKAA